MTTPNDTPKEVYIRNPKDFTLHIRNATIKKQYFVPMDLVNPHLSDSRWVELAKTKGIVNDNDKQGRQYTGHEKRTIRVWKPFKSASSKVEDLLYVGDKQYIRPNRNNNTTIL